jgi:hypothetical protein
MTIPDVLRYHLPTSTEYPLGFGMMLVTYILCFLIPLFNRWYLVRENKRRDLAFAEKAKSGKIELIDNEEVRVTKETLVVI